MAEAQDFKWYDVQLLRTSKKGSRRKVILSTGVELSFDGRAGSKTARQAVRMPSADAAKLKGSGDFAVKERKNAPATHEKPIGEMNAFERRLHEKALRQKGAAEEKAAEPPPADEDDTETTDSAPVVEGQEG